MELLRTNNCKVYLNDKPCQHCKSLKIEASAEDAFFYCSVVIVDPINPEEEILGTGYIERILDNRFHIRLAYDTPNLEYFQANYL